MAKRTIAELEDELREKDRRITELREELDEQRDLVRRMEEHAEDYVSTIESWKETFRMTTAKGGGWTWEPFWDEYAELIDEHNKLIRKWNRYLPLIRQQPPGRPLAASDDEVEFVLRLRKAGRSLRAIMEETGLSFQTVRTIVGKAAMTDRTTARWRRIAIRQEQARWSRQKRDGDALPRRAQKVVEEGRALIKEAKGLGR